MEGIAQCNYEKSGQCRVKIGRAPFWGDYKILDTDYKNWAVVYSCTDVIPGVWKTEYAWILTRKPLVEGTEEFLRTYNKASQVFQNFPRT